jgi:hypothetical protein
LLPYLIEWDSEHPVNTMASSGISLVKLEGFHPDPDPINVSLNALGLSHMLHIHDDSIPRLRATLATPTGNKTLD